MISVSGANQIECQALILKSPSTTYKSWCSWDRGRYTLSGTPSAAPWGQCIACIWFGWGRMHGLRCGSAHRSWPRAPATRSCTSLQSLCSIAELAWKTYLHYAFHAQHIFALTEHDLPVCSPCVANNTLLTSVNSTLQTDVKHGNMSDTSTVTPYNVGDRLFKTRSLSCQPTHSLN